MSQWKLKLARGLLAVSALGMMFASCAETRPDRVYVQPNYLKKSNFDGTWYYRVTITDVPYATGFTFIGFQNQMEKIRWEVMEDQLVAYRTYEHIQDGDGRGNNPNYRGAPVASYRITSHFDILRSYNPTTGEEFNIWEENARDRPWYEREYMRVDWSRNLISAEFDNMFVLSTNKTEQVAFYAQPNDTQNAPVITDNYVDITGKMMVTPSTMEFPGYGSLPACYYIYSLEDCNSQTITYRASFRKKDETRQYEPLVFTDKMMEEFGYFSTERKGYDRSYGTVESKRIRFINRHNIWSEYYTSDGKRIPEHERKDVRPIVYWVNREMPKALIPETIALAEQFNEAFTTTVNEARRLSAIRAGVPVVGDARNHNFMIPKDRKVFILCPNNPVKTGDPRECGDPGFSPNIGDLRYNMVVWVDKPHLASPLGYGPSAADPETGEIIQGNAFQYGAALDTYSSYARDLVLLMNGEISEFEVTNGFNVRQAVQQAAASQRSPYPEYSQADVERMVKNMDNRWVNNDQLPPISFDDTLNLRQRLQDRINTLADRGVFKRGDPKYRARLDSLRGTDIENRMMNAEILMSAGIDPQSPVSDAATLRRASPFNVLDPQIHRERMRIKNKLYGMSIEHAEFMDDSILGLALAYKGELDRQKIWRKLRRLIWRGVTEHEIGHTVGLRHNFEGSYDALNFHPRYWQLRMKDGKPGVRYQDKPTNEELTDEGNGHGIREYQYSSIMDYGAKFNGDFHGLGRYDRAAIKFGYGGMMEVFKNQTANQNASKFDASLVKYFSLFSFPLPIKGSTENPDGIHYTEFPGIFGDLTSGMIEITTPARDSSDPDILTDGAAYKYMVPGEDFDNRDNVFYDEVISAFGFPADSKLRDRQDRPVVPYRFCGDEFAGASITCSRFDEGADPYEVMENNLRTYRNYYIFNAFKRDRVGFNPSGYVTRIMDRYLDQIKSFMNYYVLFKGIITSEKWFSAPDGFGPFTVAVNDGFNTLAETLTMPEPGQYRQETRGDGSRWWVNDSTAPCRGGNGCVTLTDGRYFATNWDNDSGYYWFDKVLHVGFFLDKAMAIQLMSDYRTYFLGRDTATDVREYAISFYNLYGPQLDELFGGIITEDMTKIAPYFDQGKLVKRRFSEPNWSPKLDALVSPSTSFTVQLYATVFGMALFPGNWDATFQDRTRIWVKGGREGLEPTGDTVTFTDPNSKLTYVASSYKDKDGVERGIAAQMINKANLLMARSKGFTTVEALKASEAPGTGQVTPTLNEAQRKAAQAMLNDWIDNLNMARSVSLRFGYIPFDFFLE